MNVSSTNISWLRSLIFWRPFCFIDSYQIYLNGLIEQWGTTSGASESQNIYANFYINFTQSDYNINALLQRESANGETVTYLDVGSNQMRLRTNANQRTAKWSVKGY